MDEATAEKGVRRLLAELKDYLAGPGRPLVPHGFEVGAIRSVNRPNPFAPGFDALATNETEMKLRVPVIWEPEGIPARASKTPATSNLDELKELIELRLHKGEYWELHAGSLDRWEPVLPKAGRRTPESQWLVTACICSH